MHRQTAKLLLFFAFVGNLAPLAMAATAAPHACCVRKGIHRCHDSLASEADQLVIRDTGCCNQNCGRATISTQWAHPQPKLAAFFLQLIHARITGIESNFASTASARFPSTRAPPALLKLLPA